MNQLLEPNLQPSKNLQSASVENWGMIKQELKEVLKFIQNTLETLAPFEK